MAHSIMRYRGEASIDISNVSTIGLFFATTLNISLTLMRSVDVAKRSLLL